MHAVPEQIAIEARAKIMWGESIEKVRAFLMSKHVGEKDADALLTELTAERASSIRSDGRTKVWVGTTFVAAPILYYFVTHLYLSYWSLKFFAVLILLGLIGLAKLTSGISMLLWPRSVRGDLANTTGD